MGFFDEKQYKQYLDLLKDGGTFAFPTDTVWGLGCLPDEEKACRAIYKLKNRDGAKPLILMAASFEDFLPYVDELPPLAKKLADQYWPGGVTIIVKKSPKLPYFVTSGMATVGLRIPNHPVLLEFLRYTGPIATTSANLSGEPPAMNFEETSEIVGDNVNFILKDFGFDAEGIASTVVFVEDDFCEIFRQGSVVLDEKIISKIAIGADHGGFELKEHVKEFLQKNGYEVKDFGCYNPAPVDYPVIAKEVATAVAVGGFKKGIIVCGSGIGVCIAANKVKGIRAANCNDVYCAEMSRRHNDANVLTMGGRVISKERAFEVVNKWLNTEFEGGRHQRRVDMLN